MPLSYVLQKQQNSLIAGLRATNELLTMQDHPEDKLKDNSIDRDSEGEPKVSYWKQLIVVRSGVFTAVKIQVKVSCVVMVCSVVVGYQHSGGPCCLHLHIFRMKMEAGWSSETLGSYCITM